MVLLTLMGWKADWLYALVFGLVHNLWGEATRYAQQMTEQNRLQAPQPSLDALIVHQHGKADLSEGFCYKPLLREWFFDGEDFTESDSEESEDKKDAPNRRQKHSSHPFAAVPKSQETRGTLFTQGLVWFYITPDRKRVLFTYQIGPRFGRGIMYSVEGQGQSGRLTLERLCWFS